MRPCRCGDSVSSVRRTCFFLRRPILHYIKQRLPASTLQLLHPHLCSHHLTAQEKPKQDEFTTLKPFSFISQPWNKSTAADITENTKLISSNRGDKMTRGSVSGRSTLRRLIRAVKAAEVSWALVDWQRGVMFTVQSLGLSGNRQADVLRGPDTSHRRSEPRWSEFKDRYWSTGQFMRCIIIKVKTWFIIVREKPNKTTEARLRMGGEEVLWK